jgi:hypothetical protein
MNAVKITVSNSYFSQINEEFYTHVDLSDLDEVEMAAEECCGEYLNLHGDLIQALTPDLDWEQLADACSYIIEEVSENESHRDSNQTSLLIS